MVNGHLTKPKAPMRRAEDARILVRVGKPRTAYISPARRTLYHALPAATTKPKQPENLASIEDILDIVDTMGGGPEGRSATHMTHTVRHPRMFADSGSLGSDTVGSGGPHPTLWSYDPQRPKSDSEASIW